MSSEEIDQIYEKLLEMYKTQYENPKDVLFYRINELVREGKTREKAILTLYEDEGKVKQAVEPEEPIRKKREKFLKVKRESFELPAPPPTTPTKRRLRTISKYFIHGFAFSVTILALVYMWIFVVAFLIAAGFLIGFIIGFIVLFFILSGLNSFLTEIIWSIPTKTKWVSLLGHGFVLFIALIIAHIPNIIINLTVPSLATTILLFIVNAFIDGFIAKNVAIWWEKILSPSLL